MKKVLEYLMKIGAKADEIEVRRAYKRESAHYGITKDSPRQIYNYLKLNRLLK